MINIPNVFIQTRVKNENKMAFINIRGVILDLLLEIDPELYVPFMASYKKCGKVLIVKFMDAIYGTMVTSLLYYKKFVKNLNKNGF